jgi:hypothetical protein
MQLTAQKWIEILGVREKLEQSWKPVPLDPVDLYQLRWDSSMLWHEGGIWRVYLPIGSDGAMCRYTQHESWPEHQEFTWEMGKPVPHYPNAPKYFATLHYSLTAMCMKMINSYALGALDDLYGFRFFPKEEHISYSVNANAMYTTLRY